MSVVQENPSNIKFVWSQSSGEPDDFLKVRETSDK